MTKASGATRDGGVTETVEAAVKNGAEVFKAGFERAVAGYDKMLGFNKETAVAYALSANAAGKGAQILHNELYTYSKQTVGDSIANTTKLFASKSVHEAFELQSDIAMTAFEAYVAEVSKLSEIMAATTKSAFEPFQGRVQAWMDAVQAARAE